MEEGESDFESGSRDVSGVSDGADGGSIRKEPGTLVWCGVAGAGAGVGVGDGVGRMFLSGVLPVWASVLCSSNPIPFAESS